MVPTVLKRFMPETPRWLLPTTARLLLATPSAAPCPLGTTFDPDGGVNLSLSLPKGSLTGSASTRSTSAVAPWTWTRGRPEGDAGSGSTTKFPPTPRTTGPRVPAAGPENVNTGPLAWCMGLRENTAAVAGPMDATIAVTLSRAMAILERTRCRVCRAMRFKNTAVRETLLTCFRPLVAALQKAHAPVRCHLATAHTSTRQTMPAARATTMSRSTSGGTTRSKSLRTPPLSLTPVTGVCGSGEPRGLPCTARWLSLESTRGAPHSCHT